MDPMGMVTNLSSFFMTNFQKKSLVVCSYIMTEWSSMIIRKGGPWLIRSSLWVFFFGFQVVDFFTSSIRLFFWWKKNVCFGQSVCLDRYQTNPRCFTGESLVGGLVAMNFIFPKKKWECLHHPNWRNPSFFRGVARNHQPVSIEHCHLWLIYPWTMVMFNSNL